MRTHRILLFVALVAAACGGDSSGPNPPPAPPPPPPAPVSRVSVTPETADLVPGQTGQLTAAAFDAAGNALTGRSITWNSSLNSVATVSASGLVTAVSAGTTLITATSEGKNGFATITVAQGGYVTTAGGTVSSSDNAVRLSVPAGAVSAGIALTITPKNDPPKPPGGTTAVKGTTFIFGPEGTQFGTPVTVTIKYNPAMLPGWVIPSDLILQRWNGTQWSKLTNLTVDPVAHTVTGKTPGFSTVGVYFVNPEVTLSPAPASVNANQRSATFTVDIAGEGRLPDALQIQWSNTGSNGNFSGQSGRTIQYTAVTPILPPGDLDGIGVVVKGQFDPGGPFELIGEAYTTVRSDLDLSLQMQPTRTVVQYSGTALFTPQIIDRTGNQPYQDSHFLRYEWTSTTTAGTWSAPQMPGGRTTIGVSTYTAKPPSQQSSVRPKGDKTTVKVILVTYTRTPLLLGGGFKLDSTLTELGTVEGFVEVISQYQVSLVPQGASLQAGQSATFQVQITPAWQEDEQLFYSWRNTGIQGQLQVSGAQSSATYVASQNPNGGTDFVDVDVRVGTIGLLGTARASVSVEARTTVVQGRLFITTPVGLDPGRQCVEAYIVFPLVQDALSYEMHAYGFNDTAFWRTDILRTFNVPLPVSRECSLGGIGLTGSDGSQFQFYLTGFAGPTSSIPGAIATFNSRFAGMQVDVTVRY